MADYFMNAGPADGHTAGAPGCQVTGTRNIRESGHRLPLPLLSFGVGSVANMRVDGAGVAKLRRMGIDWGVVCALELRLTIAIRFPSAKLWLIYSQAT